jgi:hypothetical protein
MVARRLTEAGVTRKRLLPAVSGCKPLPEAEHVAAPLARCFGGSQHCVLWNTGEMYTVEL